MNIGPMELVFLAGTVACIGIFVGGAVVGIVYFLNKRRSSDSAE